MYYELLRVKFIAAGLISPAASPYLGTVFLRIYLSNPGRPPFY